jgi:hypothetical protein
MTQIDANEVKRVSTKFSRRRLPRIGIPQNSAVLTRNRRAIQGLLSAYVDKTGLDVAELNRLVAEGHTERSKLSATQVADRAKNLAAAEIGFRQTMENRRDALLLLATSSQRTFIILDKPFLIYETPNSDPSKYNAHYESLNSNVRINIGTHTGGDYASFVFYFLWTNPSQFAAVVNVTSALVLNGVCEVDADIGIFSGHHNFLYLNASLGLLRWTGWGNDPVTGTSNDQTYFPFRQSTQDQHVDTLDRSGGGLFGDSGKVVEPYDFQPVNLSCDMIAIPAGASMVFEVALNVQYGIEDGGDGDLVSVDFSSNEFGRRVICPLVALELLTGLSATTAT